MPSIGTFSADFVANFDGLLAPLKAAQREAQQFQRSIKPLTDGMKAIGVAASAAGGSVVAAFVGMSKAAANYGDSIRDSSIQTGVATEQLSALRFAAEQSGTSFEAVTSGLKFLGKNAVENADQFKRLGVSVKDASGSIRPVNDIFLDTAERLSLMTDGAEKTAIMIRLLGRSSVELTEFMNLGKVGIAGFAAEAKQLGLILGEDAAAQADAFNDSLNKVKNATLGLSVVVGNALLPSLTALAQKTVDLIVSFRQFADAHQGLIRATGALAAGLSGAGGLLLGFTGVLSILPKLQVAVGLLGGPAGIGILVAAVVGVIAVFMQWQKATGDLDNRIRALNGTMLESATAAQLMADLSKKAAAGGKIGAAELELAYAKAKKEIDEANKSLNAQSVAAGALKDGLGGVVLNMSILADKAKGGGLQLLPDPTELKKQTAELVAIQRAALQAKDDAARLFFALRDVAELDLSHISLPFEKLKEQLPEVTAGVRAIFVAIPEMTAAGGMLDQALTGIAVATAKAAQEQADMFDAIGRDAKVAADELKPLQKAYDETFRSVKNTAMHTFLEIFKDGEFRFGALAKTIKGIFATLANEILSTMTAKLLTPLVGNITKALSGILGKIPGLAGIFGGVGGGAAAGAGVWASGEVTAGTTATGAGVSAAATAAATAGIAGAVLAAVAVVKSQAHWEANTLIKTVHDPFVASIKQIHDAFFAAAEAGTLTSDAARSARDDTQALWDSFKEQAEAFAQGGSDEARVVEQMFARLKEVWGSDLTNIFSGMDSVIATIGTVADELERLSAVKDITDKVTMAASGFGDMEQALANLIETGGSWTPIVEFLGNDILAMAHNMEVLGLTVPPYIQAVVDQINANIRLTESMERHRGVVVDLSDVYDQLVSSVVSKIDLLDQGIADSQSAIEGWKNEIDAATDAVRASGDELKRLANQRASFEDQIKKLETQTQRDVLVAALEAAKAGSSSTSSILRTMTSASGINAAGHAWSSLNTIITNTTESVGSIAEAQKALDDFDAAQRKSEMAERLTQLADLRKRLQETVAAETAAKAAHEDQIATARALALSLGDKIRLEYDHITSMKAERVETEKMFDALNGVRLTELQTMDKTIDTLLLRASALNAERMALEALTGQTSAVSDSIAEMIADIQAARTPGVGVPALSPPALASTGTPAAASDSKTTAQLNIYGGITVNAAREGNEGTALAIMNEMNRLVEKGSVRLVASEVRR